MKMRMEHEFFEKGFHEQRSEINLSLVDVFKQYTSLSQNIIDVYTETVQTNVLQQFAMLSFKYDLSHFGEKK